MRSETIISKNLRSYYINFTIPKIINSKLSNEISNYHLEESAKLLYQFFHPKDYKNRLAAIVRNYGESPKYFCHKKLRKQVPCKLDCNLPIKLSRTII